MLVGPMLLIALSASPGPPAVGEMTAALGRVRVERGGRTLKTVPRSAVQDGDRLVTADSAAAGLFLYGGQVVYLGPDSALTVSSASSGTTLGLDRGEVRVTSTGERPVTIARGLTQIRLSRGTVRASAGRRSTRVLAERGGADVSAGEGRPARLAQGRERSIPAGDGAGDGDAVLTSTEPNGPAWTIRVDAILVAAASGSSRDRTRLRGDETALALQAPDAPARPAPPAPRPPAERGATTPPVPPSPTERGETAPAAPVDRSVTPNPAPGTGDEPPAFQPVAVDQPNTQVGGAGTFSLALGAVSGSSSFGLSGGVSSDARQQSLNPAFPGNINLISASSTYTLKDVNLRPSDGFPAAREYWSIGLGKAPTSQVVTDFRTGTNPVPATLNVPGAHAYLVRLDQYGVPDLATSNAATTAPLGFSGLLGAVPTSPRVKGAVPLADHRAVFNPGATFALGEFALGRSGNHPTVDVRRSDQDRQVLKSPTGLDRLDVVRPNPDVRFVKAADPKFFPEVPYVDVPAPGGSAVKRPPTYGGLDLLRKAAFTTLLADALNGYARRTGQTRFVVDHRVVDVTGYRPPNGPDPLMRHASGASPSAQAVAGARRSGGHAGHKR